MIRATTIIALPLLLGLVLLAIPLQMVRTVAQKATPFIWIKLTGTLGLRKPSASIWMRRPRLYSSLYGRDICRQLLNGSADVLVLLIIRSFRCITLDVTFEGLLNMFGLVYQSLNSGKREMLKHNRFNVRTQTVNDNCHLLVWVVPKVCEPSFRFRSEFFDTLTCLLLLRQGVYLLLQHIRSCLNVFFTKSNFDESCISLCRCRQALVPVKGNS